MTNPADYRQLSWPDHYGSRRLTRVHLFPEERQVSLCGRGVPWYCLQTNATSTTARNTLVEDLLRRHEKADICQQCLQILAKNNR